MPEVNFDISRSMDIPTVTLDLDPFARKSYVDIIKDDLILVQTNQPSSTYNKLWIKDQAEIEYTVPTYAEFEEANNTKATKTDLADTQGEICNDFRYEGETYAEILPAGMIVQYVPENAPIRLLRITTDIPAGSTIQQGTNAEVVNVAGLLAELIPATGVSF